MITTIPISRPYFDAKEEDAVVDVLRSGWVSQGPKCAEFEQTMADLLGIKYGRAVNSGTNAIHLALLSCDVRPGDDVIVPAFTCVATLNPLEYIGARPVLVDIDIETFGLDVEMLAKAITPRTKAIIPVHLFGLSANIEEVVSFAVKHSLKVIEDASLGLGARIKGQFVGSFGEAACLSFHPRKMITTGEGGMVLTNSDKVASHIEQLRNYGASVSAWTRHAGDLFTLPSYERVGYNYKMTDIQGAIGVEQIKKLPTILKTRREIAQRYDDALADLSWLQLPQEPAGRMHAYQSYVCLLRTSNSTDPDDVRTLRLSLWRHLGEDGIASVQGAQAMATIDFYSRKYGWNPYDFPMAFWADRASVALPVYPDLILDDQEYVIQSMRSFKP